MVLRHTEHLESGIWNFLFSDQGSVLLAVYTYGCPEQTFTMQPITPELLKKYFNGQCTAEEELLVQRWLNSGQHDMPDASDDVFAGIDKAALKEQIWAPLNPAQKQIHPGRSWLLRIAALWFTLLTVAGAGYYYWASIPDRMVPAAIVYKTIEAAHGKKMQVLLPEGTAVYLNAGSTLKVPEQFTGADRKVYLTGEAFLQVAKDSLKPFIVATPHATVRVLGTVFNVRAYAGDAVTRVAVQEGKVRVTDSTGQSVLLIRDQAADYAWQTQTFRAGAAAVHDDIAWHSGMMVFRDEPLERVATTLARWYDVHIEIRNKQLARQRFSGSYGPNPSLAVLLKDLSVVMHFNYTSNGREVVLY